MAILETFPAGAGSGVPAGGTTGQALVKKSSTDGDVEWKAINSIPDGGTTGQVLAKKSNTDKDVEWKTDNSLPAGGTQGQQLVKNSSTDGDASWTTVYKIPTGGSANQALVKNSSTSGDTKWKTITEAHTIKNSSGTAMTQRTNLEFDGLDVTDDSTNNITKVAGVGLNSDSLDDIADASLPGAVVMGSGLNYSTTEQIVGRWIDGKPLYQKTLNIGALTTSQSDYSEKLVSIGASVDTYTKINMVFGSASWLSSEYTEITANNVFTSCYTNTESSTNKNKAGVIYKGNLSWVTKCYVTVQYTKTTDT